MTRKKILYILTLILKELLIQNYFEKGGFMNNLQAKEEIRFIKEMIEKTKRDTAESWIFFFIWGVVIILAIIGNYVLVFIEKTSWIWLNWIVFMGIGVMYAMFYGIRMQKLQGIKTYAQTAVGYLCFACGMAFLLVGFIFPILNVYSYGVITLLISVIAGILVFVIGGIYEWSLLKWCGIIWWLGALGMILVHWHYRALLFIPLIIVGYLVPGFVLRSEYRKRIIENES